MTHYVGFKATFLLCLSTGIENPVPLTIAGRFKLFTQSRS